MTILINYTYRPKRIYKQKSRNQAILHNKMLYIWSDIMKIAICDDEMEIQIKIRELVLSNFNNSNQISVDIFSAGEELISKYESEYRYDIIFLDIEMKSLNGIETAKRIRTIDESVTIFFVTAYISYVFDTFRVGAFQFIKKPINETEFYDDFKRALIAHKKNHYMYQVKYKGETHLIELKEITYIDVFDHNVFIHCEKDKYQKFGRIKDEIATLSEYGFVQCHKSILVNMQHIKSISERSIILKNNLQLQLSKNFRKKLIESFNKFLSEKCV